MDWYFAVSEGCIVCQLSLCLFCDLSQICNFLYLSCFVTFVTLVMFVILVTIVMFVTLVTTVIFVMFCHTLSHLSQLSHLVIAIWKTTTKKPRTSLNFLDWVHVFRDQTCRNRKISWFKFNLVLAKFLAHVCFFIWKNVTNGFPAKENISRHITWWYKPTHCI